MSASQTFIFPNWDPVLEDMPPVTPWKWTHTLNSVSRLNGVTKSGASRHCCLLRVGELPPDLSQDHGIELKSPQADWPWRPYALVSLFPALWIWPVCLPCLSLSWASSPCAGSLHPTLTRFCKAWLCAHLSRACVPVAHTALVRTG